MGPWMEIQALFDAISLASSLEWLYDHLQMLKWYNQAITS